MLKSCFQKFVLFVSVLSILGACESLKHFVKEPEVQFKSFDVAQTSLTSGVKFLVALEVFNPNSFGIPVKNISYDLQINSKPMVDGIIEKGIHLPAGSKQVLEIPLTLDLVKAATLMTELKSKAENEYKVVGAVSVGGISIPFEKLGNFKL